MEQPRENTAAQNSQLSIFARRSTEFRIREFLTDVTVVCGARSFPAHAHVLCAGSTYFEQTFATIQGNFQGRQVDLPSVSADAFELVLDFLYTGRIPPEVENDARKLTDVLGASHYLNITNLYKFCIEHLQKKLSTQYFLDLWDLSVKYGETGMLSRIVEYAASNFQQASTCVDFLKLTLNELLHLLQHPTLDRLMVDPIIRGILEWVKFEPGSRRQHLHALVSAFNLSQLSNDYLKVLLRSEPLIKDNVALHDMLVVTASTRLLSDRTTDVIQTSSASGPKLLCFGKQYDVPVVTVFNKRTLTWSSSNPLPFPLSEGMAIAALRSSLYFIGGGERAAEASNSILQYSSKNWQLISFSSLLTEVWKAGVGVLHNKIYIVGGMNKRNIVTNTVQRFNSEDSSCCRVACTNGHYCTPVVVGTSQHLFAVGSTFRTTVERFDPSTGQWTILFPHHLPGMSPRAAVCAQQLYVISDALEKEFRVYHSVTSQWREESFAGGPEEIKGMWSSDQADGVILIRDGYKALFSYSPYTKQWHLLANARNIPWNWWQTVMIPEHESSVT